MEAVGTSSSLGDVWESLEYSSWRLTDVVGSIPWDADEEIDLSLNHGTF